MKRLLIAEAVTGLVFALIFILFPHQLINIFGAKNESVYYTDFAVKCIRVFLCLLALSCVNKGTFIFLQSLIVNNEPSNCFKSPDNPAFPVFPENAYM